MIEITKRPIVIFSSARTGSNMLANYIKKNCIGRPPVIFIEPDQSGNQLDIFTRYCDLDSEKNFLLKVHLYNLSLYDPDIVKFLTESPSVFRIKLQRRDVVRQIASQYIASMRNNKWHYYAYETMRKNNYADPVPIDTDMLVGATALILKHNRAFVDCGIQTDLDVLYEDLPSINDDSATVVTPKPANYQEILDAIGRYSKFIDRATAG
jgi:hypothetical protein